MMHEIWRLRSNWRLHWKNYNGKIMNITTIKNVKRVFKIIEFLDFSKALALKFFFGYDMRNKLYVIQILLVFQMFIIPWSKTFVNNSRWSFEYFRHFTIFCSSKSNSITITNVPSTKMRKINDSVQINIIYFVWFHKFSQTKKDMFTHEKCYML